MKTWHTPKLLVLFRDKPNHSTLAFCKNSGTDWSGRPSGGWSNCTYIREVEVPCLIPPEPPPPGTGYVCPHPGRTEPVQYACSAINSS